MRARLTVESGIASPPILELDDTAIALLGRNRDNTIVLQDRHASRFHARVFAADGQWFIRDQEATNGTRLDDGPVRDEAPLRHGQVITIGEVRLRFTLVSGEGEAGTMAALDEPRTPLVELSDTTLLQADELTVLFQLLQASLGETSPQQQVTRALETALAHTGAEMAGYLSLDASAELRLVLPTRATVDRHLSRQLTEQVLHRGGPVWLCSPAGTVSRSDSLSQFHDAVCVPLRAPAGAAEAPLGALHVYKTTRPFTERQVRFCEALAASLANTLTLHRARRALEADNSRLRAQAGGAGDELVGASAVMAQLRQQVRRLADTNCTVLIRGESGVGKELVALGLHRQSGRHRGPLVPVNCAAIASGLAESELFGHVKGAFTGATRDHPGVFAQADMGTLFLDEIGELPLDLQAKLLRAIETKYFRPVGARADHRADARVLAATNRDLEREVREGRFRRDLYFRLTSQIALPPLRDRLEDLPELVAHFLEHLNAEQRRALSLSEAALLRLKGYTWPGNVRQLKSVLEGAAALAGDDGVINAGALHLPDDLGTAGAQAPPSLNLEELEAWAIRHAVERTRGNNTQAARLLGIHRETLILKLRKYRIGKPDAMS